VLGIEGSLDASHDAYPEEGYSVRVRGNKPHLYHTHSGAGKGDRRKDLSWWPNVTTWERSGINIGCWTPMCERWFRRRLAAVRESQGKPYSSTQWSKNPRYWKNIGQDFLTGECAI
jgi:hypothetical protein